MIFLLLLSAAPLGARAQAPPLTLRQAVDRALGQNPQVAIARANENDASAASGLARTALLPQLNFTEDISRGNDPVYAFGSRLRQRQFTQADFALNALTAHSPSATSRRASPGSWMAFDSFKTQKEIRRADLFRQSAASVGESRRISRLCFVS